MVYRFLLPRSETQSREQPQHLTAEATLRGPA